MEIKNITLIGIVEEVGNGERDVPRVIIRDRMGNKIVLDVSHEEAKLFAKCLYEKCSVNFDAKVTTWKDE